MKTTLCATQVAYKHLTFYLSVYLSVIISGKKKIVEHINFINFNL